jgi:hypothetical protein
MVEKGKAYFVENGKIIKRGCLFEEISLWDKDGGHVLRTCPNKYQWLMRGVYQTIASNGASATYQRQRLRHFPWMIKDYAKALNYYSKPYIKYGCPSLKEHEARLILEKARLDNARFRERQRIIAIIKRMKAERPI